MQGNGNGNWKWAERNCRTEAYLVKVTWKSEPCKAGWHDTMICQPPPGSTQSNSRQITQQKSESFIEAASKVNADHRKVAKRQQLAGEMAAYDHNIHYSSWLRAGDRRERITSWTCNAHPENKEPNVPKFHVKSDPRTKSPKDESVTPAYFQQPQILAAAKTTVPHQLPR